MSTTILPLIAKRRSLYAIDPQRPVASADLEALFEAARWSASSYNAQPWRYIVAARDVDPELWARIHAVLVEGNQPWAQNAPVLALGIVKHNFEHNGEPNKAATHDLGAASANLAIEATQRGLIVHQMIGIKPEAAATEFGLEGDLEALTGLAIGYAGQPEHIPETYAERDAKPRVRKPLDQVLLARGF